tara:strand:+ start:4961 stop:5218 length:258 start_codon:yes stop_codon:yes gene_type:complete
MEDDFVNGLYPKKPNKDFVKATFGLRKDQFTDFMRDALQNKELWKKDKNGNDWLNIDILESKEGTLYAKINKFNPEPQSKEEIPF